jgi:hypothetical protein
MKEKIVEMLGAGVTPTQVALACGVSDSYISQLLADENIATEVAEKRTVRAAAFVESDASLDSDEEIARSAVRRNLDHGFLKPMETLRHFQVLNAARRKSDSHAGAQVPTSTVVQLNLPAAAAVQFRLTVDRQVIEVDGRSMTTMPAQRVTKMLREKKAQEMLQTSLEGPKMTIKASSLLDSL